LKPDWMLPGDHATVPLRKIATTAYVVAASALPAKICQRSSERVRIVLSVPLWSSEARCPGHQRGDQREQPDRPNRGSPAAPQARSRQVRREREVAPVPVVAEVDRHHEQDRDDRRRAEAQVLCALVAELNSSSGKTVPTPGRLAVLASAVMARTPRAG